MTGRGFAAILAIALASVTLIASGGAGAQSGDSVDCPGASTDPVNTATEQTCVFLNVTTPVKCIQKSSSPIVTQTCTITQIGTNNDAYVLQVNNSDEEDTPQDATQIAEIGQQGSGDNKATVKQDIKQTAHASTVDGTITQEQDGHQTTSICQGGSGCATANGGTNTANVTQSRWADAHASGGTDSVITQLQDTEPASDCFPGSPTAEPNACADLTQNSTSRNDAALHQDIHLLAEGSGTGTITQTQGSGDGGIDGHVMQPTTGTAQNTDDTHQHLTYDLSAPEGATQIQDPRISGGTPEGKFNLHQVGILRASDTDAVEHLGINGVCVSSSTCLILQHGKINDFNLTTRCQAELSCSANIECHSEPVIEGPPEGCTGGPPKGNPPDLTSLGFDTLDFQDAINFTFPVSLPGL
jgi:hypothetical protein